MEFECLSLSCESILARLQLWENEFPSRVGAGYIHKFLSFKYPDRVKLKLLARSVEEKTDNLVVLNQIGFCLAPGRIFCLEARGEIGSWVDEEDIGDAGFVASNLPAFFLVAEIFLVGEYLFDWITQCVSKTLPGKIRRRAVARLDVGDRCLRYACYPAKFDLRLVSFDTEFS